MISSERAQEKGDATRSEALLALLQQNASLSIGPIDRFYPC